MMTLLPVTTGAQLLGIHPKTLYHWLAEANIPLVAHATDARLKCLELQHLARIARLHDRPLPEQPSVPVVPEEQAPLVSLPARTEGDLVQKLSGLETKVATLQEHLTGLALALLHEREGALEHRLTALETLITELAAKLPMAASPPEQQVTATTDVPGIAPQGSPVRTVAKQRARSRQSTLIEYGADGSYVVMSAQEGKLNLMPDSPEWFAWLASLTSFRFLGQTGRFTAYRECNHGKLMRSWTAHRSMHQRRYKRGLGITDQLTIARLEQMAATLQAEADMH